MKDVLIVQDADGLLPYLTTNSKQRWRLRLTCYHFDVLGLNHGKFPDAVAQLGRQGKQRRLTADLLGPARCLNNRQSTVFCRVIVLLAFAVIRLRLPLISCAACPWIRALLRGGFLSSVGATIMEIGVPRSQARLSVYGAMWRLDEVFLSDDGVRAR